MEPIVRKKEVIEVLHSVRLNTYPYDNQVARDYAKFMKENPQLDVNEVWCKVKCVEGTEDAYGNGGGCDRTLIIYKTRMETENEFNRRKEEALDDFAKEFDTHLDSMIKTYIRKLKHMFYADEDTVGDGCLRMRDVVIEKATSIFLNGKKQL